MDEQSQKDYHRSIIGLVVLILAAGLVVWWFGFGGRRTESSPPLRRVVRFTPVPIVLPPDTKVFGGKVLAKSESSMDVEFQVPAMTDLVDIKKSVKHVTWNNETVFYIDQISFSTPAPAPAKATASSIRVGDSVTVTALSPIQASDNLAALEVRIIAPPKAAK